MLIGWTLVYQTGPAAPEKDSLPVNYIMWKSLLELQPAALRMLEEVEIPADADVPLTKQAPKIDALIPKASSRNMSHLATVLEDTNLCSLNNFYQQVSFPLLC